MYYAFIYPYYTYCITVWGNTFSSVVEPLIKLQKRAVRQITGAGRYDHTMPIFQSLNVMNIPKLYIYSVLIFLYKYHHQDLPNFCCRFLYDEWYISWTWYQTKKTIPTSIGSFQSGVKTQSLATVFIIILVFTSPRPLPCRNKKFLNSDGHQVAFVFKNRLICLLRYNAQLIDLEPVRKS